VKILLIFLTRALGAGVAEMYPIMSRSCDIEHKRAVNEFGDTKMLARLFQCQTEELSEKAECSIFNHFHTPGLFSRNMRGGVAERAKSYATN
jgi:hypothetical protein